MSTEELPETIDPESDCADGGHGTADRRGASVCML